MPTLRSYPRGYAVEISGAKITSARNAQKLVLKNKPGASEVNVRVTPR